MWGNILTEVSYLQNFNMGFSNNKSDILIHLTQWQYWWWFWFTFLWILYYLLVARVFRYRTLKFNPRIASTLRPHGKWGDFLTCLIPITWCINILINSNFILKLIEWQSESSLFTLRVRAKQWYWIYKLDLRNISDVYSAPRSIGRNKWQSSTFGDLQTAEDYLHLIQMRAYNTWAKDFWAEVNKKFKKKNKWHVSSPVEYYKVEYLGNLKFTNATSLSEKNNLFHIEKKNNFFCKNKFIKYDSNYLFDLSDYSLSDQFISNIDGDALSNLYKNTRKFEPKLKPETQIPFFSFFEKQLYELSDPESYDFTLEHPENYSMGKVMLGRPDESSLYSYSDLITPYFIWKSLFMLSIEEQIYFIELKKANFWLEKVFFKNPYLNQKKLKSLFKYSGIFKKKLNPDLESLMESESERPDDLIEDSFDGFLTDCVCKNVTNLTKVVRHPDYDDETRILRTNFGKTVPLRIVKQPYSDIYFAKKINKNLELFRFRFNRQQSTLGEKPIRPTVYLTFKQKRYTLKNNISSKLLNNNGAEYSTNPFLKNKNIIEESLSNSTRQYKLIKKAKNRAENFNVRNWNRLLRSRRVLVLPAHVNITVITNSFDIVHSWHIPGLGLKMDCLPGRATHHTLYIDNVGFYYGQCAEICGRYHHHMPIRVCALPFEHFLVWWHTFGLPKLLFLREESKANFNLHTYYDRKFSW